MLLSAIGSPSQPANAAEVSCSEGTPGQTSSRFGKQWALARNLKYVRSGSWRRSHGHRSESRCNSFLIQGEKNPKTKNCKPDSALFDVSLSMYICKTILIATESEDSKKLFILPLLFLTTGCLVKGHSGKEGLESSYSLEFVRRHVLESQFLGMQLGQAGSLAKPT